MTATDWRIDDRSCLLCENLPCSAPGQSQQTLYKVSAWPGLPFAASRLPVGSALGPTPWTRRVHFTLEPSA